MKRISKIRGQISNLSPSPSGTTCSSMSVRRYNLLLVTAAVLALLPGFTKAATITVKTDRNPVVLQESFRLIFEAAGDVDGDPDFSPLEKDFQVLSTSTSTSMSIVNAKITRTKQWQLTVLPLTAGNLVIPAISFGRDKSPQTLLAVITGVAGPSGQVSQDMFLDVKVTPEAAYVQAELIYTVKLYRAVATSNETLSEPELDQGSAIIEVLDADRSYDDFFQGRRYAVFERRYGIYPQVSGTLSIKPVRFQAQVSDSSPFSLDPFGARSRTVVRQSEPVQLAVKPVPGNYQGGHWLPAADVKITEEWSKNPFELLPNEPVTRTVTLTAQGLTASQLPEMQQQLPADFKQYPDIPVLENRRSADGITGVRQQKNAIIPARAGNYVLPAISLTWWNTATQTMENAVLPERRVQVAAAEAEAVIEAPELPALDLDTAAPVRTVPDAAQTATAEHTAPPGVSIWQWLTCILALTWVITLVYILKNRERSRPVTPQTHTGDTSDALKALKRACEENDPQRAKVALLRWAGARANASVTPVTSLGDLERHSSEELAAEIRALSRRLYSRTTEPWRGEPLWQAFLQERKTADKESSPDSGDLEPLFRL